MTLSSSPWFAFALTLTAGSFLSAQEESKQSVAEMMAAFNPQTGETRIGDVAVVKLGEGWCWLDGADGRRFLQELGNQPSPSTLGVALPPDFAHSNVFAVYSYADEGHVADDEAPDYDELLLTMQENAREESKARKNAGLQGVEMLGWAEPPHYDTGQHKLFWAERLLFEGEPAETLNYNVRILGRTGHLVVNGVGGMEQLAQVAAHSKDLLAVTGFVDGQRYTDFDPAYDKVAAYGIGGLIAGKLALKVGLLAKLGLLLKAFIKPLLVGLVIIGGLIWKVLGGRRQVAAAAEAGEV